MADELERLDACISGLLEKNADKILNKITSLGKDQVKKLQVDFGVGFKAYLKNACAKYSRIKTILYRSQPRYLYDFFECNTLSCGGRGIDASDVANVMQTSHFLILQGTGGIGKSTLFKHFFMSALRKDTLREDPIPIFVELKELSGSKNALFDDLYASLNRLGFRLEPEYFTYALRAGCFLFLLDGYDEISADRRADFFRQLDELCDRYPDNYYLLSSRPTDSFLSFQRFTLLNVQPFSKAQALRFVERLDYDRELTARFARELRETLSERYASFASNPLLLSIMLLTYDNYADIPEKLHLFYNNAFETLYWKHDATKSGFRREMHSGLSYDNFRKVFAKFSFVTFLRGCIEFSYQELRDFLSQSRIPEAPFSLDDFISDLVGAVCLLYLEGFSYAFTHRTFQEYFAAVYIDSLSDEQQQKAAGFLVKSRKDKLDDMAGEMLYDMNPDRFEKNILMPLLREVEPGEGEDRFEAFVFRFVESITFWVDNPGERVIPDYMIVYQGDLILFLLAFVSKYMEGGRGGETLRFSDDDLLSDTNELSISVYGMNFSVDAYAILHDPVLRDSFRESWAGKELFTLSGLLKRLEEKHKARDDDLEALLALT